MKHVFRLWHHWFGHPWYCVYDLGSCLEYRCHCGHHWTSPREPTWIDMWKRARGVK